MLGLFTNKALSLFSGLYLQNNYSLPASFIGARSYKRVKILTHRNREAYKKYNYHLHNKSRTRIALQKVS